MAYNRGPKGRNPGGLDPIGEDRMGGRNRRARGTTAACARITDPVARRNCERMQGRRGTAGAPGGGKRFSRKDFTPPDSY